jgi:small GTP-binding protein
MSTQEEFLNKIAVIEEEIRKTPYHKGTEHHIGLLRAKLAKLRNQLYSGGKSGSGSAKGLRKHGDASIALIGPPSVGKSTLLNLLTSARSEVGGYNFTTTRPIPGMMELNGARLQFIDLPGLIDEASFGRGGGKQILSAARAADLLLLMADCVKLDQLFLLIDELKRAGFRINSSPLKIRLRKLSRGGLRIIDPFSSLSPKTIEQICQEFGIKNAELFFAEKISSSSLIDYLLGNRVYLPGIFVINKLDLLSARQIEDIKSSFSKQELTEPLFISAERGSGIANLKKEIWQKLGFIRVYLKKEVRLEPEKDPVILKKGSSVRQLIKKIREDWLDMAAGALIWGKTVKFGGQEVSLDYVLDDKDVVFVRFTR